MKEMTRYSYTTGESMKGIYSVFITACVLSIISFACNNTARAQVSDVSDDYWSIILPTAAAREVDMKKAFVGSTRDSLVAGFIENTCSVPIKIELMFFEGTDAQMFSVASGSPPLLIPAGGRHPVEFSFQPSSVGMKNAFVVLVTQAGDSLGYRIFGEGIIQGVASLCLDTIRAYPGDMVEIPLYLRGAQSLAEANVSGFSAELRFNSTLLSPVGETPAGTIVNGERSIPMYDLPVQADEKGALVRMQFVATLGTAEGTPLHLENAFSLGGDVFLSDCPGYFQLLGVCHEGGTRLFDDHGRITLAQNRPNPFNASTAIDYSLIESGRTRLFVIDLLGREVAILVDGEMTPGTHTALFDASTLQSGTYIYILQTPSYRLTKLLQVMK